MAATRCGLTPKTPTKRYHLRGTPSAARIRLPLPLAARFGRAQGQPLHSVITDAAIEKTKNIIAVIGAAPQSKDLLWEAKLRQLRRTAPDFEE
jgi:hypothetical protein